MIETNSITQKSMHTNMRLQRLSFGINPMNMKKVRTLFAIVGFQQQITIEI
jgi:hypothetical protein